MSSGHRCRVYSCSDQAEIAHGLCITHTQMVRTIRDAQRGPIPDLAVRGFLEAISHGYGEGDATPGAHLAEPNRAIPKRTRRKRGAA